MHYDFFSPQQITFGWGRRAEVGLLAAQLGQRGFLVSGSRTLNRQGALGEFRQRLQEANVEVVELATISREPEVADVDDAVRRMLEHQVQPGDFVLGIGGGSAMDLAKAVAALATNRQGDSVQDFLEGVGQGFSIDQEPLPLMVLPTTAGTGSEATKNAVISSYDPAFKKSLRSSRMVPNVVLVDPELTVSVPADITAHTGMDAITQLIESFLSKRAQPIPQALCLAGLQNAVPALAEAVRDGTNRPARETLSHAALLSGMALANSGLGLAHGVAAALGVHCKVPHGLACAVMLPTALRINAEVCRDQMPKLALALTGLQTDDPGRANRVCLETIESLAEEIGIPRRLSQLGVTKEQIPALVQGSRGNSMSGNPRDLSDKELSDVLEEML
jgi:alcohol dehydrogenase class IV